MLFFDGFSLFNICHFRNYICIPICMYMLFTIFVNIYVCVYFPELADLVGLYLMHFWIFLSISTKTFLQDKPLWKITSLDNRVLSKIFFKKKNVFKWRHLYLNYCKQPPKLCNHFYKSKFCLKMFKFSVGLWFQFWYNNLCMCSHFKQKSLKILSNFSPAFNSSGIFALLYYWCPDIDQAFFT